jgi:DNA-binding beta-propeller fold protein YncE
MTNKNKLALLLSLGALLPFAASARTLEQSYIESCRKGTDVPVPIAVVDAGRKVIAGNSNRFAASNAPQNLVVLDAAKMEAGTDAALGTIAAGSFPREMAVSADGHTLFLTNFGSNSLQLIDVDRLPLAPSRRQ